MGSGPGVVTQPDAEVLHLQVRVAFLDLSQLNDLTVGLLHLLETLKEVPESRLGHNMVRCEDGLSVERRMGFRLRRDLSTHDFKLTQLQEN